MKKTVKIHGISIPSETHTLIIGAPGTGKTRSILRPMLQQYLSRDADDAEAKVGLLLMDPKGDMLQWVSELLASIGRDEDLVVIGDGQNGFNLFSALPLSNTQYAARLSSMANSLSRVAEIHGDSEFWQHQQRAMIEALIQVARIQCPERQIQIADVVSLRFQLLPLLKNSFEQMTVRFRLDELGNVKRVLKDFANLPGETRECVLATVSNCLSVFNEAPLVDLMNPSPEKSVDLGKVIQEGKCLVVSCATRSFGNSTLPLMLAIKEAFADLILSRAEIEIDSGDGYRQLNPNREILYVSDEAHRVLGKGDDGGELDFLDTSREFRCRAILATQSLSSLQSVMGVIPASRLVSLFGNHIVLNSIDPATGDWAERLFGSPEPKPLPPPLLMGRPQQSNDIAWEGPQTLSQLKVGEFLLRTNSGKVHRKKANWSHTSLQSP